MKSFIVITLVLIITLMFIGCEKQQVIDEKSICQQNDWGCICARINDKSACSKYSDCTWTNYHSNEYYCMERFCMTYSKAECEAHKRCMWAFNKLGGDWQCEGVEFVDESRFIIPNKTS